MLNIFAHEGHDHTVEPGFFDTIYGVIFVNMAPFVLLALLILVMDRTLKISRNVQIIVTLAYLLLIGLLGYNTMPVASIIGLVAGFSLCLALVILPLKDSSARKQKLPRR